MTSPRLLLSPGGTIHALSERPPRRCATFDVTEMTLCGIGVATHMAVTAIGPTRTLSDGWVYYFSYDAKQPTCEQCAWVLDTVREKTLCGYCDRELVKQTAGDWACPRCKPLLAKVTTPEEWARFQREARGS